MDESVVLRTFEMLVSRLDTLSSKLDEQACQLSVLTEYLRTVDENVVEAGAGAADGHLVARMHCSPNLRPRLTETCTLISNQSHATCEDVVIVTLYGEDEPGGGDGPMPICRRDHAVEIAVVNEMQSRADPTMTLRRITPERESYGVDFVWAIGSDARNRMRDFVDASVRAVQSIAEPSFKIHAIEIQVLPKREGGELVFAIRCSDADSVAKELARIRASPRELETIRRLLSHTKSTLYQYREHDALQEMLIH